ncbi:hypothetical protein SNOG_03567 [Parastagonospora nodorum SN15]|uniref:Uncharacterized protein n=1 Tax=Phaeosphaeria nodorum (strain SN15 / ATCC MYA-4574 / FGSC 10173) TaxID=321614 RepID=Q0UXE7_PHANO|nr:hypothetical protein SNOG_03567 [Parastagonospora nodorum SN15]EAT88772.1 hypothetical protein SNOG_03567 [Parastagonospora nodorum SN15]
MINVEIDHCYLFGMLAQWVQTCVLTEDAEIALQHGNPLQLSMPNLNATVFQRTGGGPGKPNCLNTLVHLRAITIWRSLSVGGLIR